MYILNVWYWLVYKNFRDREKLMTWTMQMYSRIIIIIMANSRKYDKMEKLKLVNT